MNMKTNKSFTKRLKLTKKGKMMARKPGGNHYNAKAPREKQLNQRGWAAFEMDKKSKSRFLPDC